MSSFSTRDDSSSASDDKNPFLEPGARDDASTAVGRAPRPAASFYFDEPSSSGSSGHNASTTYTLGGYARVNGESPASASAPTTAPQATPSRRSSLYPEYSPAAANGVAILPGTLPGTRLSSSTSLSSRNFDRYPMRGAAMAAGSKAPGTTIYQSRASVNTYTSTSTSQGQGSQSPFVTDLDFSPFGGYPATAFPLYMEEKEGDDYIHNPDPILDEKYDRKCQRMDRRGVWSLTAFIVLIVGLLCVFVLLPVLTYSGVTDKPTPSQPASSSAPVAPPGSIVEVLTTYQYTQLSAVRKNLIDPDTPQSAYDHKALDGSTWNLVFSDEFNKEGRTFYDGDDQFWTAQDFQYYATNDLEWYDPDAVTTEGGALVIRLDAYKNHNLFYRSGMLQSWNKFCFTQGYLEVSAQLPGKGTTPGLWPGIWTLGNLGRPGFGSTTEGVWPYSYQGCDAGITANQSSTDGISFLPGQKLSACTCPGHDHPNTGTGRGAPEIDALEGTVNGAPQNNGVASQSLQVAPFDVWYMPDYDFIEVYNKSITAMNTYCGGPFQQAISGTTTLNHDWFELSGHNFQTYGFEYLNSETSGYIRWFVGQTPSFTLYAPALGPNGNVGQRTISQEPMSIVINAGLSNSWSYIDWPSLTWPSHMRVDYVRVYQPADAQSTTCDPPDFPTFDYIQNHLNAYSDSNLTSWAAAGYAYPPTSLLGQC